MYYSAIGLLGVMILLIENRDILLDRSAAFDKPAWKVYRKFLLAVFIYYLTDILWGWMESRKLPGLLFAVTSLYYIAMAAGMYFWTQYAFAYVETRNKFERYLLLFGQVFGAAVSLLVVVNIFVPVLFTVDEECVYHTLALRHVVFAIQFFLLLLVSVFALPRIIRHRRPARKVRRYRFLGFFGLIMAVFLFAQIWFPYMPLYAVGYMLGTCMLRSSVIGDEKEEYLAQLEEAEKIASLRNSISALLDHMPAMSFSKDAETGEYLACNQSFAEYAHKDSPEGVVGLTDAQIFDADTAKHFVEDDRKAISMDEPYVFFEDVPDAVGNQRQFQTTKLKFVDSTGRLCLLGMCADVTDMVRIQRENAAAKEEYEKARSSSILFTNITETLARDYTDLYYVNLDTDEYVEYRTEDGRNSPAEARRGERFFDQVKIEILQAVYPEDQEMALHAFERETLLENLNQFGVFIITYRLNIAGQPTYMRLKASRMANNERFIVLGVANVDVEWREAKKKSEALARALAAAEEANKAKTSFLSSMSHEIRTPMNAIIGLDTLALHDQTISPQTREYLEKIGGSAKHLLALINDILDMSRIESGRLVLRREEFSFSAMLEQINTMVMSQCRDKGLTYECRLLSRVDDDYIGDDMKLKEVLINILSNAIKFTNAPGSVTMAVERTALFEDQSTLRFRIKDTGVGMDKSFIPKIFDAFSQEDGSRKNKYGSTGLGMAITKSIVEMMNGTIDVESEKGVGTEFTVTITLRNCERKDANREDSIDPRTMRVLVVDDDEVAAEHARMVLDEVGIRADICTSGAEALRMMDVQHTKQEPYNLVLMDWNMPGMNGLQASEAIRKQYSNETTVVVLTAYNWDDIQEEAHRVGVDSFLAKPLFASNVIEEFERVARRNNLNLFKEKKRAELAGRHILLAEDMEINAEIMMDILDMKDVNTDHAENGKIVVDMFQKSEPGYYAAILMDVRMPEMDGLEAAAAIRALDREDAKKIPIIALTANAFDEDVQRSLQAGMNAHLTKPVEPDHLYQTLEELIYEVWESKEEQ